MDDGYSNSLAEFDRAEMAEQRLEIALSALKHLRRAHPATGPAVKLALRQVDAHQLKAS